MPALFTRILSFPSFLLISLIAFSHCVGSPTSCSKNETPKPFAVSSPRALLMSEIITFAPSSLNLDAIPFPKPWAPPVIRAVLFFNLFGIITKNRHYNISLNSKHYEK